MAKRPRVRVQPFQPSTLSTFNLVNLQPSTFLTFNLFNLQPSTVPIKASWLLYKKPLRYKAFVKSLGFLS
ncbi:MAG: hypothetical protein F6K65_20510 [Moorea sp. SIO3C2]|nr:hypothetical protein [Moorena sp. SIO3C2]